MAPEIDTSTPVDVVIIGGGLAGLSAALTLSDYNRSHAPENQVSFVVLERDERLGGRTLTDPKGADLDFGGGYVGAAQNYIQYLLRRYGIQPIEEYLPRDKQWLFEYSDGRLDPLPGDNPQDLPGQLNCAFQLLSLDTMAMEVRNVLNNPKSSRYAKLDGMSVQDWINLQRDTWEKAPETAPGEKDPTVGMSADTAQAFVCSVRSAFSVEPQELSFFYLLYYAACAGSYSALVDVAGGPGAAEGARLPNGTQELVQNLRNEITGGDKLNNILPTASVATITQDASGAHVTTADKKVWRAKRVIVAMSPATSVNINHKAPGVSPAELAARSNLEKGMAACRGRTIKGFVRFKGPFWRTQKTGDRQQGLMGFFLSAGNLNGDYDKYPLDWTLDNVWDDPQTQERRSSLMTFIVGAAADHWIDPTKSKKDRALAVIDHLRRVFKFDNSALLDSVDIASNYVEYNWPGATEAQILPSPAAMLGPNKFLDVYQALRHPIGVVHYAGSESATEWNGYMDGAVQSGFRTGNEVLAALKKPL